jgi:hypothetical protein
MSFDPARQHHVLLPIIAFTAVMMFAIGGHASPITYQVNRTIGAGRVMGFIETDGTIGVLNASNFLDWSLTLSSGTSISTLTGPLSGGNSSVFIRGTDVAAFDSFLLFNFSGIDYGVLMFEKGLFSGLHYYCDATQPYECAPGETVVPDGSSVGYQNTQRNGVVVIGTAADPVPEPATFSLLCSALVAFALKKKV